MPPKLKALAPRPEVILVALTVAMAACAAGQPRAQSPAGDAPAASTPAGPSASIQINYAHPGDYLKSLNVRQFIGAHMVSTREQPGEKRATVVRFDGGVPVWEIGAGGGLAGVLSSLPGVGLSKSEVPTEVKYGVLPSGFVQTIPDSGPPTPLQPGNYYVFAAERGSGSVSFQAIRVAPDGSLEVYDAEPRAGTSFLLCCNVDPHFTSDEGAGAEDSPSPEQ